MTNRRRKKPRRNQRVKNVRQKSPPLGRIALWGGILIGCVVIAAFTQKARLRSEVAPIQLPTLELHDVNGKPHADVDQEALNRFSQQHNLPRLPDLSQVSAETAIDIFSALEAIEAQPKDAEAIGQLGRVLHSHQFSQKAIACYERASQLSPESFEWPYYIGRVNADAFEFDSAVTAYDRSAELNPDYAPTLLALGNLHLQLGDAKNAQRSFDRFIALRPKSSHGYLGAAQIAFDQKAYKTAIELLSDALSHNPKDFRVHSLLGQAYQQIGDKTRAEHHLAIVNNMNQQDELAKQVFFDDPLYHKMLASNTTDAAIAERLRAAMATGQSDVAIRLATELCKRHPNDAKQLHTMALTYKQAMRFKESLAWTEKAITIDDGLVEAHLTRAQLLLIFRRNTEALKVLDRVVAQQPNSFDAQYYRGTALVMLSKYQASVNAFRKATQIRPGSARAHVALAEALSRAGQPSEAATEYRRALELDPTNARAIEQLSKGNQ